MPGITQISSIEADEAYNEARKPLTDFEDRWEDISKSIESGFQDQGATGIKDDPLRIEGLLADLQSLLASASSELQTLYRLDLELVEQSIRIDINRKLWDQEIVYANNSLRSEDDPNTGVSKTWENAAAALSPNGFEAGLKAYLKGLSDIRNEESVRLANLHLALDVKNEIRKGEFELLDKIRSEGASAANYGARISKGTRLLQQKLVASLEKCYALYLGIEGTFGPNSVPSVPLHGTVLQQLTELQCWHFEVSRSFDIILSEESEVRWDIPLNQYFDDQKNLLGVNARSFSVQRFSLKKLFDHARLANVRMLEIGLSFVANENEMTFNNVYQVRLHDNLRIKACLIVPDQKPSFGKFSKRPLVYLGRVGAYLNEYGSPELCSNQGVRNCSVLGDWAIQLQPIGVLAIKVLPPEVQQMMLQDLVLHIRFKARAQRDTAREPQFLRNFDIQGPDCTRVPGTRCTRP